MFSETQLASRIDHTLLKPEATADEVCKLAAEAKSHGFAAVCVNPVFVSVVHKALSGSSVRTASVAGVSRPGLYRRG